MFPKKLKSLRLDKGLSQKELAEKIGVSVSAVGMYELGLRKPGNALVRKLCRFFSVTSDYLMMDDEEYDYIELNEFISEMKNRLMGAKKLTFNGRAVKEEDIIKIAQAMEIGTKTAILIILDGGQEK